MPDWRLLLMGSLLGLLLLCVGFVIGRFHGRSKEGGQGRVSPLQPHYLQGLNYLLNERPDAAIESFIEALDVNSETLETHLTLANLLRKRGEVDRAIRIHQNLLSRPRLSEAESLQVQLELARDFISAGLLDRAELLLVELLDSAPASCRSECLQHLIEIYRDEKEWQKGIAAINQLSGRFSRLPEHWRQVQAHYYCQLAEEAIAISNDPLARNYLNEAVASDKQLTRASLLLGQLEKNRGNFRQALNILQQVFYQDPALLAESLPLIRGCYFALDDLAGLEKYLGELVKQSDAAPIALERADLIAQLEGSRQAAEFLRNCDSCRGSLRVTRQMLRYQLSSRAEPDTTLQMTEQVIDDLLNSKPLYRCGTCGFGGQQMHWLCPSCKNWGTVKPVE